VCDVLSILFPINCAWITVEHEGLNIAPCGVVEVDQRFRVRTAMLEAVRTSDTSAYFNETTLRCVPECYRPTRRCENLKSHKQNLFPSTSTTQVNAIFSNICKGINTPVVLAVQGIFSLGQFECWDPGLESRSRYGCLSVFFCVVFSCREQSLRWADPQPKESYEVSENVYFRNLF
jgi:hypothetical protein